MIALAVAYFLLAAPMSVFLFPRTGTDIVVHVVYSFLILVFLLVFMAALWIGLRVPILEISEEGIRYTIVVPRVSGLLAWSQIREVSIMDTSHGEVRRIVLSTLPRGRHSAISLTLSMRNIPITSERLIDEISRFSPESLRITRLTDATHCDKDK